MIPLRVITMHAENIKENIRMYLRTLLIVCICLINKADLIGQVLSASNLKERIIDLGEVKDSNENFESFEALQTLLKDVEIVMLGEQSHQDATTFETKIKLIKYLHQEMGYDLLVFESGFYDSKVAWDKIAQGGNVRQAMGQSVNYLWSTTHELIPLANYLEVSMQKGDTLKLLGFDNQFLGNIKVIPELEQYLKNIDPNISALKEWEHLKNSVDLLFDYKIKEFQKRQTVSDTIYLNNLLDLVKKEKHEDWSFWVQTLESLKTFIADVSLDTYFRDKQMAENLKWIQENYPKSKIICWGATSHFLYNSHEVRMQNPIIQYFGGKEYQEDDMMGCYVKDAYGNKLFTIGFTAGGGHFGMDKKRKINPPKSKSLEYLLANIPYDNFLLSLNGLETKSYLSRPLGHRYMKNDISRTMDAVIFNREMKSTTLDYDFFRMIYRSDASE